MIRIGVCGFPKKRAELFEHFDVVEVQRTFYNLVPPETLARLTEGAPPRFVFTMKAFQGITHPASSPTYRRTKLLERFHPENLGFFRETLEIKECSHMTREMARALRAQVVVFQCPPSFHPTLENRRNLSQFFEHFPREGLILAWEPRGKWAREEVRALCQSLDLVHVVDPFVDEPQWGCILYFRLHGKGSYQYFYSEKDLLFLAEILRKSERDVFCLFNNIPMLENALSLKEILSHFSSNSAEGF